MQLQCKVQLQPQDSPRVIHRGDRLVWTANVGALGEIDENLQFFLRDSYPSRIRSEEIAWGGVVVDGGPLVAQPSTVVDLSGGEPVLVREGKGDIDALELFG